MENIKIGDYIRSIHGEIAMVSTVLDNRVVTYPYGNIYFRKAIKKHSENLIDLVEVGDVVNKCEVVTFYDYDEDGNDIYRLGILCDYEENTVFLLGEIKIETILTKEQYENNCYKVDDKNG